MRSLGAATLLAAAIAVGGAGAAHAARLATCEAISPGEVARLLGVPVTRTAVRDGACIFTPRGLADVLVARSSAQPAQWYADTERAAKRWSPTRVPRLGRQAIRWETATGGGLVGKSRSRAIAAVSGRERLLVAAVSPAGGPALPSWKRLIAVARRAFT
ncbi:MAG: hypothetical protein ACKVUT_12690 [Gaiella sp.]